MTNHEAVNGRHKQTFAVDAAASSSFNRPIERAIGNRERVMQHAKPPRNRANRIERSHAPWFHDRSFTWQRGRNQPLRLIIGSPVEHLRYRMPTDRPLQPEPL